MNDSAPSPQQIATALERRVFGQPHAVREIAVAMAKKLAGLPAGNVLLIGPSGSGKTTAMRAVESYIASDPALEHRSTLVRVHANVLAQEADSGAPGEKLLGRLFSRATEQLGAQATPEAVLDRVAHGIVFIDEIDKIRGRVGDQPNVAGIRAQEALLTVMENERLPIEVDGKSGQERAQLDTRGILFVAAGAFEGLYDAVYDRVTVGEDRGSLQPVTVLKGDRVHEETPFALRQWLRSRDLFDYGMSPQFLSRFDATVLLEDLGEEELLKIFLGAPDSALHEAKAFFARFEVDLVLSPQAARAIAREAAAQPRLGARALKEVFRRVVRDYEFAPTERAVEGTLLLDQAEVEKALGRSETAPA